MPKRRSTRRRPPSRSKRTAEIMRGASKRAFDALRHVKKGKSLSRAARLAHTSPRTVRKYAAGALKKVDGVYVAQRFDRSPRRMKLMTPTGLTVETITGSRAATRIATYMSAVDHYLRTGDASRLRPFIAKAIRASGKRFPFVTDLRTLRRLAYANEVSFDELYGDAA